MRELRKRVRPDGAAPFSAPAERGTRTAAGVFALSGRGVFRCTSAGGFAVCGRRERAAPRGRGKKEGQPAVFLPL